MPSVTALQPVLSRSMQRWVLFRDGCAIEQGAEQSHAETQAAAHAKLLTCPPGAHGLGLGLLSCHGHYTSEPCGSWTNRTGSITSPRGHRLTPTSRRTERRVGGRTLQHLGTCIQLPFYFSYKTIANTQSLKKNTRRKFLFPLFLQKINKGHVILTSAGL